MRYKLRLWDLRAWRVVIFFNKSESSSFLLVDVGSRLNHVNRCILFFVFLIFFLPVIILCHDLHNKLVSELRLLDLEWRQSLRLRSLMEEMILVCGMSRCVPYWFNRGYPKHWRVKMLNQQQCMMKRRMNLRRKHIVLFYCAWVMRYFVRL